MGQKSFGSNKFVVKTIFWSQKFSGQKDFWLKKILGSKNIWGQKIWGQKKFRSKRIGSEIFFVKRNPGRVNPRGRIYDPPPENSRVKIVLGCC